MGCQEEAVDEEAVRGEDFVFWRFKVQFPVVRPLDTSFVEIAMFAVDDYTYVAIRSAA